MHFFMRSFGDAFFIYKGVIVVLSSKWQFEFLYLHIQAKMFDYDEELVKK